MFNNKNTSDSVQVKELIEKVEKMANQKGLYTNKMYEIAAAAIEKQLKTHGQLGSNWQSWLEAALSPKVLEIIMTMVVGLVTGAATGVSFEVAVNIVATCGNNLMRNFAAGTFVGASKGLHAVPKRHFREQQALNAGVSVLREAAETSNQ